LLLTKCKISLVNVEFYLMLIIRVVQVDNFANKNFLSLADCGGLLGLFLGCSVLSIIELLYYFIKLTFEDQMKSNVVMVQRAS
jgi:Amiloride-sensitive sodium channel